MSSNLKMVSFIIVVLGRYAKSGRSYFIFLSKNSIVISKPATKSKTFLFLKPIGKNVYEHLSLNIYF